jgi:hypothetical protein
MIEFAAALPSATPPSCVQRPGFSDSSAANLQRAFSQALACLTYAFRTNRSARRAVASVHIEGITPEAVVKYLFGKHHIFTTPIVHEEFQGLRPPIRQRTDSPWRTGSFL